MACRLSWALGRAGAPAQALLTSFPMDDPAFRYRFGTAEFDESRFELRVSGLPVEVEPRALEVLAYLLRHAGEVVTKEELLRELWGGRATVEKVLTNAVNKVRRALGEANAGLVATQSRQGYRLDGTVTRTAVGRRGGSGLQLAAGHSVPGRPNFELREQLGRAGGSEVWAACHRKTRELRVFKFALDGERLRALKREATLLRLLRESLPESGAFTELLDWNFETAPFFLECAHAGQSLALWGPLHLQALALEQRLALFLQICSAVAAAHSVGVLHKDLKPANVLVSGEPGRPHVVLTDFGNGTMLQPDRLAQLGITRMGLTVEEGGPGADSMGTPMYIAPELFEGQAPSVKSDVFALGILLYQVLAGRLGQPMASNWEAQIADELLRDDIRQATDGNPERRLASAAVLSERLRSLSQRRTQAQSERQAQQAAQQDRQALERARARRPYRLALMAALVLGTAVALWMQHQAALARDQARAELARAASLTQFLNEDLIGRSNPLVWAKGQDATLRDVLLAARERLSTRFADQPEAAAALHSSLGSLFSAIDLLAEAESEARQALALAQRHPGVSPGTAFEARAVLARVLARRSRFDEAERQLAELEQLNRRSPSAKAQQQTDATRGALLVARGEYAHAVPALRAALRGLEGSGPTQVAQRDILRVDLIRTLVLAGEDHNALEEGRSLIAEAVGRKEDSQLVVALARMAMARAQGEDHAAAQQLLLQAQPVIIERLGEDHSRHLQLLGEMLGVAYRSADWPRASQLAQTLHERFRVKLGADHVLTYVSLLNWGRTLDEAGRPKEAADKVREAHRQLQRLAGPKAPQTQDAAYVLALVELELGRTETAQALIDSLQPEVLESGRATGQWPVAIDALRGIALQQRGHVAQARPLLDDTLLAMKEEETLVQPSRLYLVAKAARARMR